MEQQIAEHLCLGRQVAGLIVVDPQEVVDRLDQHLQAVLQMIHL